MMAIGTIAAGAALLGALATAASAAPAPQQLLDQMSARFNAITDYQVTVDSTARVGSSLKERRYQFAFKKPGMIRLQTLTGENKGGELCVCPDGRIRGRKNSGMLKVFAVTMSRGDARLKDSEGIGVWEMDFGSTIRRLRAKISTPGIRATVIGSSAGSYLLEIRYGAGRLAGVVERYAINVDTLCINQSERLKDGAIVERSVYSEMRVNNGLANSYFEF